MPRHQDLLPDFVSALHVTNGDCTDLAGTGLAERILVWFDVLHEGPVPDLPDEDLRRTRSEFLSQRASPGKAAAVLDRFRQRDKMLAANRDGTFVLWFEADLYDQLQLVQILARLAELDVAPERITLICIGEYPGIAHFGGLGQLSADQLRELPGTGACSRLTSAALELGSRAWAALRAPRPDALGKLQLCRSGELRFLGEAVDRLCREYPSTRDGLSLTERRLLAAAAGLNAGSGARAPRAHEVFSAAAEHEARPFLGDTWAFAAMAGMVKARLPLLSAESDAKGVDMTTRVAPTETGLAVLSARADHVRLNGIDRWIGGVALQGPSSPWRFDEGRESVVAIG